LLTIGRLGLLLAGHLPCAGCTCQDREDAIPAARPEGWFGLRFTNPFTRTPQ